MRRRSAVVNELGISLVDSEWRCDQVGDIGPLEKRGVQKIGGNLDDWGEVRGAVKTGVASRRLQLEETRICGTVRSSPRASTATAGGGSAGASVAGVSGSKVAERHDGNWRGLVLVAVCHLLWGRTL